MFKKILSLVLSLCLILSVAVPGVASGADGSSSGSGQTPDSEKVTITLEADPDNIGARLKTPDYQSGTFHTYLIDLTENGTGNYGELPTADKFSAKPSGYQFKGWATSTTGNVYVQSQDGFRKGTSATTLYARWEKIKYTITLELDGGSLPDNKTVYEVDHGAAYSTLPTPTKEGYTFTGWKKKDIASSTDTYTPVSLSDPINDAATLKADWDASKYTVSFNYNYPQSDRDTIVITPSPTPAALATISVTYKGKYGTLPTPDDKAAPAGYTFSHWTDGPSKDSNQITTGSDVLTTGDRTLYAQWTKEQLVVALNYGSALTTPKDARKYVLYATPKPADSSGSGSSGGGTTPTDPATPGDSGTGGTRTASTTPTATPTPTPEPGKAYYGQNTGENALPSPQIDGYDFLGWAKSATKDSDGNMVVPSAEPTVNPWDSITKDHTLYAKWQPAKHTLTFNLNYTPAPSPNPYPPKEAAHDTKVINLLPTSNPTRSGYRFAGWTYNGKLVDNSVRLDQNMTVYASWVEANSVKLEVNGGTLPANTTDTVLVSNTGSENVWPALPQPTRTGYDFLGWYTENTGGDRITAGMEVSGEIPLRLYARWAARQYTVTFDYNGTNGSTEPKKYTYGEKYLNLPTNATWPGHTFMGWYTAASGGERVVGGETVVSTAADHTLYARWGFKISFEPGNGFGDMEDDIAPLGEDYALPECQFEAPDGMSFYRWAVGTARGEQLSTGTRVPISRNTTLYAIWKESPIEIEVSSTDGGSLVSTEGSSDIITMERGSSITFTARPSRGYQVAELIIDGERCPKLDRYTFTDLQENHSIHAVFEVIPDPGYSTCDHNYDCPLRRFQDLNPNAWYHDAVHYCLDEVFMNGMSSEQYAPNSRATRAMLVTVLWQAAGCPYTPNSGAPGSPFTDVSPQAWYYKQVCWAKEEGIVSGYTTGKFGPDMPVTREQLVTILWQYAGRPGHSDNRLHYYDSWAVSNYAWDAMLWATENGLISGTGNNMLNPKGYATRAQIAQFTMAFMRYTGRL